MQNIGKYFNREIFWLDYHNSFNQLPEKHWICLAIANSQPNDDNFDKFVRTAVSKNIAEFKGHGQFGELLHDLFDQTMVIMETMEQHKAIDVMSTWHNDETLADAFWQCFFATCLPGETSQNDIKIICTDLDGINRMEELKSYLKKFESGWLPSHNVKHEVWKDPEGLTTVCLADEREDGCRKLLERETELIHSFYAANHYEAMTIYYKFMNWGTYTTEFEIDKQPYEKKYGT